MKDPVQVKKAVENGRSRFEDQPQIRIREAASALDVSAANVHRILWK